MPTVSLKNSRRLPTISPRPNMCNQLANTEKLKKKNPGLGVLPINKFNLVFSKRKQLTRFGLNRYSKMLLLQYGRELAPKVPQNWGMLRCPFSFSTQLDPSKLYQIFMLYKEVEWGSSGNSGPKRAAATAHAGPSFPEWPHSRPFSYTERPPWVTYQ